MKEALLERLPFGKADAIRGPQLCRALCITDLRRYRQLMADMAIHEGIAVLGDAVSGYWLAATDTEIQENADKLDRTAKAMLKRAQMVRKLKPYVAPGQQRLSI